METIIAIETAVVGGDDDFSYDQEEGYRVVTDKQEILMVMDAFTSCCESWGCAMSAHMPSEFIGAELINIVEDDVNLTDADLDDEECCSMLINLVTDRGILQFAFYNIHNGYYGHGFRMESLQLTTDCTL